MDYIEDDYVYVISPMMSKNEQTLKLLADFLHVGNYIYETLAQAANNDLSNIFVPPYAPFNIWAGATGVLGPFIGLIQFNCNSVGEYLSEFH